MSEMVLVIAVMAGILSLDITAFGQFMVSRPIVAGTLIGYMLGDVKTGLWIGMTVELIWIGALPMGAAIPLETTAVAILSVVWGLHVQPMDRASVMIALALSIPAAFLFRRADIFVRYLNVRVMRWVEAGVMEGKEKRISFGILIGMTLFFFKSFILYLIFIYPGMKLTAFLFSSLGDKLLEGFRLAWLLLPVLGMGLLLVNFRNGKFPCNKIEEIVRGLVPEQRNQK